MFQHRDQQDNIGLAAFLDEARVRIEQLVLEEHVLHAEEIQPRAGALDRILVDLVAVNFLYVRREGERRTAGPAADLKDGGALQGKHRLRPRHQAIVERAGSDAR